MTNNIGYESCNVVSHCAKSNTKHITKYHMTIISDISMSLTMISTRMRSNVFICSDMCMIYLIDKMFLSLDFCMQIDILCI